VAVRAPQPLYPPDALRAGIGGEVAVTFTVNADGSVDDVAIVSAQPQGVFDKNVLAAVRRWKFKPISKPMAVARSFKFAR
jgi:protein TonB